MAGEELERSEVEALLETRRELGSTYDRALVESFADRIERAVEERTDARLERRGSQQRAGEGARIRQFVLGVISAGVGVPITIVPVIASDNPVGALTATIVGWLGIVGVNAAHASVVTGRRDDRPGAR